MALLNAPFAIAKRLISFHAGFACYALPLLAVMADFGYSWLLCLRHVVKRQRFNVVPMRDDMRVYGSCIRSLLA